MVERSSWVRTIMMFALHLLATDCIVTTNVIIMPYKIVYSDSKLVTATMHGCNYNFFYYMYTTHSFVC